MRIVLMGQAPFGAKTLEALLAAGENVVAVYTPKDRPGARPDPLKEAARAKSIPVFQPEKYKSDDAFEEYRRLEPDLTVLAFVTDIIPPRYFEAATLGAVCYHPSILPRHRGASAINWAIIMGDTRTGLTIFRPDGGIDTGPILLQKEVDIGPDDTTGSLYFDRLFPMGVEAIVESVGLIREGKAPRVPQDETKATYEPICNDAVARIDWERTAVEIFNFVRGCDPQPGAYAFMKEEKIRFYGAALGTGTTGEPSGSVLQIDERGVHVAVPGGRILVGNVRPAAGTKMKGGDWAREKGIKVGDRFV